MTGIVVVYRVPVPYTLEDLYVEVYGEPDMGAYEWRVVSGDGQRVLRDTRSLGYGSGESALRDALVAVIPD
jgi:hypothetical protein